MADDPRMETFLENQSLERIHDYAARGRRLADLDDAELTRRWIGLWRVWAEREFETAEQIAFDDVVAEMQLRDREPPFELVAEEMEAVFARSRAYQDELDRDPERRLEEERQMSEALDAFSDELKRQRKN
jgi:hypothetical protein